VGESSCVCYALMGENAAFASLVLCIRSGTSDHLTSVIMRALLGEGGLSYEEIASKLVCFGVDGVSTFQGSKMGVTTQIREK
jgi:hypothetical protein